MELLEPDQEQPERSLRGIDKTELDVHLEEYRQLRAEINLKQTNTHRVTNFAILLCLGIAGALATADPVKLIHLYILLIAPLLLANLGFLFAYEVHHIVTASGYVHVNLRSRLNDLLQGAQVLNWEIYKKANAHASDHFLDFWRWALFFLPSGLCLLAYYHFSHAEQRRPLGAVWFASAGALLNALLLALYVYRLVRKRKQLYDDRPISAHIAPTGHRDNLSKRASTST